MSAATPTAGTRPFVLTAADFATNPEAVVAQLGWSFEVPSAGVLVSAGARASTAPAPARSPAIGAGPSQSIPRPSKRPRQDLLGRCFLVRWGDVCDLWPQWEYCNRNRVPWRVLAHASSHDRLQCQYRGASDDNRALIGNGGVREFALDHRFKSLESLRDLLPSVPKFPYHQIAARRFRCYEQPRVGGGNRTFFRRAAAISNLTPQLEKSALESG
jgi:hypothetical protein